MIKWLYNNLLIYIYINVIVSNYKSNLIIYIYNCELLNN